MNQANPKKVEYEANIQGFHSIDTYQDIVSEVKEKSLDQLAEAKEICRRTRDRLSSLGKNKEVVEMNKYIDNLPTEEEYRGF